MKPRGLGSVEEGLNKQRSLYPKDQMLKPLCVYVYTCIYIYIYIYICVCVSTESTFYIHAHTGMLALLLEDAEDLVSRLK